MTSDKTRINMRISQENLDLVRDAAELSGQDMTSFVLSAALDRARETIIHSHVTRLTRDEAVNLESALNRNPQHKPALAALLANARDMNMDATKARGKVEA